MDFHVTIEDNKYMEKFFKSYPQYEEEVKENIKINIGRYGYI